MDEGSQSMLDTIANVLEQQGSALTTLEEGFMDDAATITALSMTLRIILMRDEALTNLVKDFGAKHADTLPQEVRERVRDAYATRLGIDL